MKYKKTVLKNGMRIITIPLQDSQSAIGMVLVETGSDFETKEQNGLSHFLEHMVFKETTNRTGDQIKLELDGMGAASNAFTSNGFTGYYAKASKEKITKIIDLISDLYLNPTFPQKDIDIERGVIIEEINMYEDLPQSTVFDVWNELLYPNTPAGRPVIGPKENIKAFNQKDFVAYHNKHYTPSKTVCVVAGNIDEKSTLKQIKSIFEKLPIKPASKRTKVKQSQKSPALKIKYKKTDQSHLVLGFRAFDHYDERNYALKVAATILGKGFSSRLFTKMRDELGMCYYTRAMLDTNPDRGSFVVHAGVTVARTHEAIEVIMDEFKKLKDQPIPKEELQKAKDFLIGHFAIGLETSEDVADYFGFQELLHDKILQPKEYVAKIKAVTAEDIQKILKQIMKLDKLNFALIGPFEEKDADSFAKYLKI
jgi:predicted Zn-dependent peptidase